VISDVPQRLSQGINGILLPPNVPEWLSPVCAVVPGQFFALQLATVRGVDVDQPRYLNKVTSTD
jgi:glucosamine--fructose-6-phosphate aminotransferase (isomerizing)